MPFLEQDQGGRQGKQNGGVVFRVYLLRRCSARIHGQSATACRNVGEGKMEPSHTFMRHRLDEGLDSLDWDGVLRCDEDVIVPSFFTTQLSVKVRSYPSKRLVGVLYLPFFDTGLYRFVDHSATTTQVSAPRCNTLLSDTACDRSLVKRICDLVRFEATLSLLVQTTVSLVNFTPLFSTNSSSRSISPQASGQASIAESLDELLPELTTQLLAPNLEVS